MQYIKIGVIKVPYKVKTEGTKKIFQVCGMKIPFSTYTKDGKKMYKLGVIKLRVPFLDKYFISQSQSNYLMKEELDDAKIKNICEKIFEEKVGYKPNLDEPKSMNEKIFWFKLNYHNPLVTTCCDKFAVKAYVDQLLGKGHTIKTIASWGNAEDIDFSILPQKYALKVNWSSGFNIIVKDSKIIDEAEVRKQISEWMQPQKNSYYQTFNWGYKNMTPVVYAEEYMEQADGQLYDYKFFCCNGKPKFWFIATDRYGEQQLTHDFFDMDFNKLDFDYGGRAHSKMKLEKPKFYDEMLTCAEELSKPFPFVRVDFYETDKQFYVGEMTFYPGGGILPFSPVEWDYKLGEYIPIPER